jgi:cell division protein FtsW
MLVTKYFIVPVGIVCGLILPENLSTALMVFGISMIIMFIGRVPFKFLVAYIGMGIIVVALFVMVLAVVTKDNRVQVWKNRIEHFFSAAVDEDEDFQSYQQADCLEKLPEDQPRETCFRNRTLTSFLQL